MTVAEIASMVFGALGVGGGAVSLYIRGTIAETIVEKLNGRYVGSGVCEERHKALTDQLKRMEHRTEQLTEKVDNGFGSLQARLFAAQISRDSIERNQITREHQGHNED